MQILNKKMYAFKLKLKKILIKKELMYIKMMTYYEKVKQVRLFFNENK